jgi:hypothetical protein
MKMALIVVVALLAFVIVGCGFDEGETKIETVTVTDTVTTVNNNNIPMSNAGPDQATARGNVVTLDASGSRDYDPDDMLFFTWSVVNTPAGVSVGLTNSGSVATWQAASAGIYDFKVDVGDGLATTTDYVRVTVEEPSSLNMMPLMNATGISTATILSWQTNGTNNTTFDLLMCKVDPPSSDCLPMQASDDQTEISYDPPGYLDPGATYIWGVVVNNGGYSSGVPLWMRFTTATGNQPPVADAGSNQSATIGATVNLSGSGINPEGGTTLTYLWVLTPPSGNAAVLTGSTTATPSFTADIAGTYTATLVVNDGTSNSLPDIVSITVQ